MEDEAVKTEIIIQNSGSVSGTSISPEDEDRIRYYQKKSKSDNTTLAYTKDWTAFETWCDSVGRESMPCSEQTICLYLLELVDRNYTVNTIQRKLSSITMAHRMRKIASPMDDEQVKVLWEGIRNEKGIHETRKKAITTEILRNMVEATTDNLKGLRDRALLLVGFAGAFRRSELVGINFDDIEFTRRGALITLRRSKTDQQGVGYEKALPFGSDILTCPVRTLQDWIKQGGITEGAVFRSVKKGGKVDKRLSDRSVALIVQQLAEKIGLEPKKYGGHSLRAGFATSAYENGVGELSIMAQTGHSSIMTLRKYIRGDNLFINNAASKVGL